MKKSWLLMTIAMLIIVALPGCDNGRATVTGQVTYQGQPVESGSINFEPLDGRGGTAGGTIENGAFRLSGAAGVVPGKKRVRITVMQKTGKRVPAGPMYPAGTMFDDVKVINPPLQEAEVVAGEENQFDFPLKVGS